jgi:hypothetical protein
LALDNPGTDIGDYNIHIQRLNGPELATEITFGPVYPDLLTMVVQTKAYTFTASAGDSLFVQMVEITSALRPHIRLYDPTGVLVAGNWGYTTAQIGVSALPLTGTYAVLAMDYQGIEIGDYTIQVIGVTTAVPDTPVPVEAFALYANHPNPFNPATTIRFDLPEAQPVRMTIYTIDGRVVTTLVNEKMESGRHEVVWNGRDNTGRRVASGTYLCYLEAGPYRETQRMVLVK